MAGQIIKRGDNKWLVRIYLGADPGTGKRRYHSHSVNGTKKDAQRYRTAALRERDLGTFVEPARMDLNGYLDRWLNDAVKPRVRARTLQDYRRYLDYVRCLLGNRRLDQITSLDIQAAYTKIGEDVSAHAVVHCHRTLRDAFGQAVKWSILARNPTDGVSVPAEPRREMCVLTPEEAMCFQAECRKHDRGLVFSFTVATAMRPGEVLGLRWQDCDLTSGAITVQQSLATLRGGKWEIGEPKTHQSRRTIPLPKSVTRDLIAHRAAQAEHRLRFRGVYEDLDLVFASPNGRPLNPDNLSRRTLKPVLKSAGLPRRFRWYDCRHTCATLLLAAGENPKVVSERLGHTKVAFTLDRYGHVLPGMQEKAADRLEQILFGKSEASPG